jgi:hypothetical protein
MLFSNITPNATFMDARLNVHGLRSRAAYYRQEAALARQRARLVVCRALASHLEREAAELERVIKGNIVAGLEAERGVDGTD